MKCKEYNQEIKELPKGKTIMVKELGIEVETQLHTDMNVYSKVVIPKGMRLLTLSELLYLYNKKLVDFKQEDSSCYVNEIISNPSDQHREKKPMWAVWFNDYVDMFHVVGFNYFGDDGGRSRGVRFVRDMVTKK